ncbi:MAG: CbtA family protein, partial [Actinomycetota bacterium]|nr:CbtA family protein [Actinomycetota bacterium]
MIAGLAFFAMQSVTTRPVIERAEVFERAAKTAPHGTASHHHADDADAWEPADGIERAAYTVVADGLIGIGYALLLVGLIAATGRAVTLWHGLAWGAA